MTTLTANQRPLSTEQQKKIESLQSYLGRIAHNIVATHYPDQDPDELLAVMNAAICERAAQDPSFLEQDPPYIVKWAGWRARDYCRREAYGHGLTGTSLDADTDSALPLAETLPAPLADLDLPIDVARALATLNRKRQTIAAMLAAGFQRREIADRFGVTSPTLSWDLGKIRAALQPLYAAARG